MMNVDLKDYLQRQIGQPCLSFKEVSSGVNSRSVLVKVPDTTWFVKIYLKGRNVSWNRQANEFKALDFLWEHKLRIAAKPLWMDVEVGVSAFEALDERNIQSDDVTKEILDNCLDTLIQIQSLRDKAKGQKFLRAAESCISLEEYNRVIEERLSALKTSQSKEYLSFHHKELIPSYQDYLSKSKLKAVENMKWFNKTLPEDTLILSPSDVGLHNVMVGMKGKKIKLIDFEYFGWDDPLKMISDFALQPAIPLNKDLKSYFVRQSLDRLGCSDADRKRFQWVYPLLAFKWILIVCNVFLPLNDGKEGIIAKRELQLSKAKKMLDTFRNEYLCDSAIKEIC